MEDKIRDLLARYVDACGMCTKSECDVCTLNMTIEDLEEILNVNDCI